MTGKKKRTGKDTTDTSRQGENETPIKKAKPIKNRHATEEDYKRMNYWNVGTFHRASTLLQTKASGGEKQEKPPHCPQELVKALRKQGIKVKLPGPLEERLQNDLMMEGWLGKHPKKK